jgi:hypothetical protein
VIEEVAPGSETLIIAQMAHQDNKGDNNVWATAKCSYRFLK